jgi:hypothetical protein
MASEHGGTARQLALQEVLRLSAGTERFLICPHGITLSVNLLLA